MEGYGSYSSLWSYALWLAYWHSSGTQQRQIPVTHYSGLSVTISPASVQSTTKHILVPITNPLNHHQVTDSNLNTEPWEAKGITQESDLHASGVLKPFQHFNPLFQYIRITHCLLHSPGIVQHIPKLTWNFWIDKLSHMKGNSLLYQLLQDKISFTQSNSQIKWEWDLGTSFTDDQWVAEINPPFKVSKSASL